MKPNKYWLKRQAETASALTTKSINETNVQRSKYYRDAMRRIISDFEKTYNKVITAFGQDKQVTPADLYKLDRYRKMQAEMREELKKLGDKESALLSEKFERHWKDIYESAALPSEDNFVKYSSRNAAEMINEIWCADGKNWSQRVWHNVGKLQEELNSSLLDCVISGKTTKELKQKLQKDFGVSYNRAKSVVNTEMAHIQTQSAAQRYKDSGVEYYEFLADTDKSTCDICAALDGKRFKLIEMQPGKNAPPMHPNDRCCIIPVIEKKEDLEIIAQGSYNGYTSCFNDNVDFETNKDVKMGIEGQTTNFVRNIEPTNLNEFNEVLYGEYIDLVPPLRGFYDIKAHGEYNSIKLFNTPINAETLANILDKRKDYKQGIPIRLLSCYTGKLKNGRCFAQDLSNMLGVEVIAPDFELLVDARGKIRKKRGGEFLDAKKDFRHFKPQSF